MISYFREKAAHCRRLAAGIVDDRVSDALIKLAEEFEAKAGACIAQESGARGVGAVPVKPPERSEPDER